MDYLAHIPACALKTMGEQKVNAVRRIAIERRTGASDQIGLRLSTPRRLLEIGGIAPATTRLNIEGTTLLETLEAFKPAYHYSVASGKVLMTEGTTIYVTGRTKGNAETIVATWDYGEGVDAAIHRLSRLRRLLMDVPDDVAYAFMKVQEMPDVPPPQVLLSDVIGVGEARPHTTLAGCGGAAPIAIAVGTEDIEIKMDHRLFDPPQMVRLADEWMKRIDEALQ